MESLIKLLQLALAFIFTCGGMSKIAMHTRDLTKRLSSWVNDLPAMTVKLIGMVEVFAGLTILLPGSFHIPYTVVLLPAVIMVATMLAALWVHSCRREYSRASASLLVAIAAVIVAADLLGR